MDPSASPDSQPRQRKRKHPRPARSRRVEMRLHEDEYAVLAVKAREAGVSVSALLRDHFGQVTIRNRDDERQRLMLLNRINANINMLSRWANTFKAGADAWMVAKRLEALQAELSKLLAAWEGSGGDLRIFSLRHRQR
jgi:hypothetical protein